MAKLSGTVSQEESTPKAIPGCIPKAIGYQNNLVGPDEADGRMLGLEQAVKAVKVLIQLRCCYKHWGAAGIRGKKRIVKVFSILRVWLFPTFRIPVWSPTVQC